MADLMKPKLDALVEAIRAELDICCTANNGIREEYLNEVLGAVLRQSLADAADQSAGIGIALKRCYRLGEKMGAHQNG